MPSFASETAPQLGSAMATQQPCGLGLPTTVPQDRFAPQRATQRSVAHLLAHRGRSQPIGCGPSDRTAAIGLPGVSSSRGHPASTAVKAQLATLAAGQRQALGRTLAGETHERLAPDLSPAKAPSQAAYRARGKLAAALLCAA
jgi:hypothetical protein